MTEQKHACYCRDCEDKRNNQKIHLDHPFYAEAHDYREQERREQILKGAAKYPKPFDPSDWTAKELLQHAMQENIDQGHYIYGLFEKIEGFEREFKKWESRSIALASALEAANRQTEYWRSKAIQADQRANDLQNTLAEMGKGANIDE